MTNKYKDSTLDTKKILISSEIQSEIYMPAEVKAPGIIQRGPIKESFISGTLVVDAFTPIGRGQRELIIGDRYTGKSTIALDAVQFQGSNFRYYNSKEYLYNIDNISDDVNSIQDVADEQLTDQSYSSTINYDGFSDSDMSDSDDSDFSDDFSDSDDSY